MGAQIHWIAEIGDWVNGDGVRFKLEQLSITEWANWLLVVDVSTTPEGCWPAVDRDCTHRYFLELENAKSEAQAWALLLWQQREKEMA